MKLKDEFRCRKCGLFCKNKLDRLTHEAFCLGVHDE